MVLAELQSQEESYVAAMQALVNDYLEPLEQADPGLISNEMVFISFHRCSIKITKYPSNVMLHCLCNFHKPECCSL